MAERPEDLNLPNSVIARMVKESLPEGVNISKDARLAIAKAASVFVLYATSCSNNFSMQHKRKTISGGDVLEAMKEMDFERFVDPLQKCLEAYKAQQQGKKDKKKKDQENATADKTASPTTDPAGGVANDSDDDVIMTPGQNGATDNGHDSEIEFVNGGE